MATNDDIAKELYKIHLLDEFGHLAEVIVYDHTQDNDETRFQSSFLESERVFIHKNNTPYRYSDQQIHKDDSIKTIKNKIIKDLNYMVGYEEIYLFSRAKPSHSQTFIYNQYVGEERILNDKQFTQLSVNYSDGESHPKHLKTQYTKSDFLELTMNDKVNMVLGREFQKRHDAIFPVNPFCALNDESLKISLDNQLLCFENHVLLHYKHAELVENIIYVCLAENVLKYGFAKKLNEEAIIMLYYPLLYERNITSTTLFFQHRQDLLTENKKKLTPSVFKHYEKIDLFYKVFRERKSDIDYIDRGISSFYITIYPDFKYKLPLETIFKNIHALKEVPFIKLNPGFRRENLYRLYSETITKYGEKIPFLSKNTIIKFSKELGRNNHLSFFVASTEGDIFIDIVSNGNMNVYGNLKQSSSVEQLDAIIKTCLNGVIININDFLQKSGYALSLFKSLQNDNVVIVEALYTMKFKLIEKLTIKDDENWLKSVFDIIEDDIQDGAVLRFKRIDNYTEMNAQDIFIAELVRKYNSHKTVVTEISKYYDLPISEAETRYMTFMSDHEQLEGHFANKRLDVVNSPGILCDLRVEGIENIFTANFTITDSLDYVEPLFIYIDSLLRITQQPKSTGVSKTEIKKISLSKVVTEDTVPNVININRHPEPSIIKPYTFEDEDGDKATEDIMYTITDFEDDEGNREGEEQSQNELIQNNEHMETLPSEFGDLNEYDDIYLSENEFEVLKEAPDRLSTSSFMFSEEFEEFEDDDDDEAGDELSGGTKENEQVNGPGEDKENNENQATKEKEKKEIKEKEKKEKKEIKEKEKKEKKETKEKEKKEKKETKEKEKKEKKETKEKEKKEKATNNDAENDSANDSDSEMDDVISGLESMSIDNINLKANNTNIFLKKMQKLDPVLFSTTKDGKYRGYATLCQRNLFRQPIILTDKEKKDIEKKHPGSINYAINYGSDPEKKNWFICPKYWCLKTNAPMDEADIKAGKCGKEIPQEANVVPKGHYHYKFANKLYNSDSVPGYITGKHAKGHCLPCCFKKEWDSKYMAERRKECGNTTISSKSFKKTNPDTAYIISVDIYPIEQYRKGYLPTSVQLFLQTDNSQSMKNDNTALLKDNSHVILRFGVEHSTTKSFVACIADLYSKDNKKQYTIPEMLEVIINTINIDTFLKLHNGSFFSIFKPKSYNEEDIDTSKPEYEKFIDDQQKFINSGDEPVGTELRENYFSEVVAAYENFRKFLLDESSYIDYTFLWDIVCEPNPKLFVNGLNLAILQIIDHDIRDNVELVCPSSTYSKVLYDSEKPTFILIKQGEFFEPVYTFDTKSFMVTTKFNEGNELNISNISKSLKIIRNSINNYCSPHSSLPRKYEFKQNIPVESLKEEVLSLKFQILKQIVNYQMKCIGLYVMFKYKRNYVSIYLPCRPSSMLNEKDFGYVFMDDDEILGGDYITTRNRLHFVSKKSKNKILCKPVVKIVEDKVVVGIVTETNQFILLSEPSIIIPEDDLKTISGENYVLADKALTTSNTQDTYRTETIKNISSETKFYEVFRYVCKTLLNEQANNTIKKDIQRIIEDPNMLYLTKIRQIKTLITKCCSAYVSFHEYHTSASASLSDITDCRSDDDKQYCLVENETSKCVIPKRHLLSGELNEKVYFDRLSDEILRFKRIQSFMMDPKTYMSINSNQYVLNPTEMILVDSLITSEYFSKLKPFKYANTVNISYDIASPLTTQKYSNNLSKTRLTDDNTEIHIDDTMEITCIDEIGEVKGNVVDGYWRNVFPAKTRELVLNKSTMCSYYMIIRLFKLTYNSDISLEQLKKRLITIYSIHMENEKSKKKIYSILRAQGKKKKIDDVISKTHDFDHMIMEESYNLSGLDIWLLAHHLKLPIILFSAIPFKTMAKGKKWMYLYDKEPHYPTKGKYYFIRQKEGSAQFNFLDGSFDLKTLGNNFEKEFNEKTENKISIIDFLQE